MISMLARLFTFCGGHFAVAHCCTDEAVDRCSDAIRRGVGHSKRLPSTVEDHKEEPTLVGTATGGSLVVGCCVSVRW
jgi:hypothetical protein